MKLLLSLFGCLYSRMKLLVFAMSSRVINSSFVCFINGLEEKHSHLKVIFVVCRLPLTADGNVVTKFILNLTNRFHVAVRLFSNRRRQNVVTASVTHSAIASCATFFVLTTF